LFDKGAILESEACTRCDGRKYVPILLNEEDVRAFGHKPEWGDRDCPRCGGSGLEPDECDLSEMKFFYGPSWDE